MMAGAQVENRKLPSKEAALFKQILVRIIDCRCRFETHNIIFGKLFIAHVWIQAIQAWSQVRRNYFEKMSDPWRYV